MENNTGAEEVGKALDAAAERWEEAEVAWGPDYAGAFKTASEGGRLVLLAVGEAGEAFEKTKKVAEDRTVVKYHSRLVFVELAIGSDTARALSVTEGPALVVVDPSAPAGEQVVARLREPDAVTLRRTLRDAFRAQKKRQEEARTQ